MFIPGRHFRNNPLACQKRWTFNILIFYSGTTLDDFTRKGKQTKGLAQQHRGFTTVKINIQNVSGKFSGRGTDPGPTLVLTRCARRSLAEPLVSSVRRTMELPG